MNELRNLMLACFLICLAVGCGKPKSNSQKENHSQPSSALTENSRLDFDSSSIVTPTIESVNQIQRYSGNEGGNGGETIAEQDVYAWFLTDKSERTIRTCIQTAPDFGVDENVAKKIIEE